MEITINYYGQAVSVSVEVYEYLTQADHKAENLAHEQRRHWDGREFDEYIIATEGRLPYCATPEELVCQRETLDELLAYPQADFKCFGNFKQQDKIEMG